MINGTAPAIQGKRQPACLLSRLQCGRQALSLEQLWVLKARSHAVREICLQREKDLLRPCWVVCTDPDLLRRHKALFLHNWLRERRPGAWVSSGAEKGHTAGSNLLPRLKSGASSPEQRHVSKAWKQPPSDTFPYPSALPCKLPGAPVHQSWLTVPQRPACPLPLPRTAHLFNSREERNLNKFTAKEEAQWLFQEGSFWKLLVNAHEIPNKQKIQCCNKAKGKTSNGTQQEVFLSHHQRKVALPPSISTPNPALQAVPALLGLSSSHASYASEPSAQLHFQVSPRHGFHQGHKPNGLECKGGTQLCRQMFWYVHVSTCSMAT